MRSTREHATNTGHTYMVTSAIWGRRSLFSREPWARLLIDTLYHYRASAYLLHEFVIMPDHIHVLITPKISLEKAVQFIKGGFSYRAKKELGSNMEVWRKGFSDHRVRDADDYRQHVLYIRQNPVRKHLSDMPEGYPYSSATAGVELDPLPQGLKPESLVETVTARLEGVPFQSNMSHGAAEGGLSPSNIAQGAIKVGLPPSNTPYFATEARPFQSDISHGEAANAPSKKPSGVETEVSPSKPRKTAS